MASFEVEVREVDAGAKLLNDGDTLLDAGADEE
jgi:hypothetical protein